MKGESTVPSVLLDGIRNRRAILFTGAGFNYGCKTSKGAYAPLGNDLAILLSDKFLGGKYKDRSLSQIGEFCISVSSRVDVELYIRDLLEDLQPLNSHLIYSRMPWRSIYTTNYDCILESAFAQTKSQRDTQLVTIYKNTLRSIVQHRPNPIVYHKLHGSIEAIGDADISLVLSTDQYATYAKGRDNLFKELYEDSQSYPIVFVGYGNQDSNIRPILSKLDELGDRKQRSYMVGVGFDQIEVDYWASRRIEIIQMGHEKFASILDKGVTMLDTQFSSLKTNKKSPIYNKFTVKHSDLKISPDLLQLIDYDTLFVHNQIKQITFDAKLFYKGHNNGWDPIIANWDAKRNLEDKILTDLVIKDKYIVDGNQYNFVIRGYGGSGKSILLKRLAWELAVTYDQFVLYHQGRVDINIDALIELTSLLSERLYLVIDNYAAHLDSIQRLLQEARRYDISLTVISAEQANHLKDSDAFALEVTKSYDLLYLERNEASRIIAKLKEHESLGNLDNKSEAEQLQAFTEDANNILIVALHEATSGKPYEDIIAEEYNAIPSEKGKALYRSVSIFHYLGVGARAGLISRVHDIRFIDFRRDFFEPLQHIVFAEEDYFKGDYLYRTRHRFIGQTVYEYSLVDSEVRYDEYMLLVDALNYDYADDRIALNHILNANHLIDVFKDTAKPRSILSLARESNPFDWRVLRASAVFEMKSDGGDLVQAKKYLQSAQEVSGDSSNESLQHSVAEYHLRKASSSSSTLNATTNLNEALAICAKHMRQSNSKSIWHHTAIKIGLRRIEVLDQNYDNDSFNARVRDLEKFVQNALLLFPDDEYILTASSRFNTLIGEDERAYSALRSALESNPGSVFIATRLSKYELQAGNIESAVRILKRAVVENSTNRDLHYQYANSLEFTTEPNYNIISSHYRKAFTRGDSRVAAQFMYARSLYLAADYTRSLEEFHTLGTFHTNRRLFSFRALQEIPSSSEINRIGVLLRLPNRTFMLKDIETSQQVFVKVSHRERIALQSFVGSNYKYVLQFNSRGAMTNDLTLVS